jgi:hypothetical protein
MLKYVSRCSQGSEIMKVCQGVLKALTTLSENSQPTTQPNRTAASLLEFGKIDRGGEDMSRYGRSCQGILKCLTTLSDRLSMAPESRHLSSGFTAFSEYRHMRMDSGKCGGYPGVPHSTDRKMEGRVWKEGVKKGGKEKGKITSRDGLPTGNDRGEDVTLHGNTEGERDDIEEEEVGGLGRGGLSGEDTGLDSGTVGNSLVGVDALLELLATEEVAEELLDLGDTGRTSDKDDLVNLLLGNVGVLENLSNRVKSARESLLVQVLETSTGDVGVEVLTVEQRVDLNSGLGGVGESTLGTLASSSETAQGTGIARDVLLGLLCELLLEVVKEVGVEVLSTEMGTM